MKVVILKVDGTSATISTNKTAAIKAIERAIGATCLDTVNLRDGRVMFVDDAGYEIEPVQHGPGVLELKCTKARKPVNQKATQLYWSICKPGTTHRIVGDVAIVNDADFA